MNTLCLLFLLKCGHVAPPTNLSDMQIMLAQHCKNQRGMIAFTTSPQGKFATCYAVVSMKRLWTTRV
jgi:hypothetical protein